MNADEMRSFMDDFKTTLLRDVKEEIKTNVKEEISTQIIPVVGKLNEVEQKVEAHENKINSLDSERRKRNIIIYRIQEENGENYKTLEVIVMNIFNNTLKVECKTEEIDFISRIGKNKNNKFRPILVKMVTFRKKLELLRNRENLKNANINIDEDYSPEVRARRKQLFPQLKTLRAQGKIAEMRQDRIIILEGKGKEKAVGIQSASNAPSAFRKRLMTSPPDISHSPYNKKFAVPASTLNPIVPSLGGSLFTQEEGAQGEERGDGMEALSHSNEETSFGLTDENDTQTK